MFTMNRRPLLNERSEAQVCALRSIYLESSSREGEVGRSTTSTVDMYD